MVLHLTPYEIAQVNELAAKAGVDPATVAHEALSQALAQRAAFVRFVEEGIASGERGELIDHETVFAEIERKLGRF